MVTSYIESAKEDVLEALDSLVAAPGTAWELAQALKEIKDQVRDHISATVAELKDKDEEEYAR